MTTIEVAKTLGITPGRVRQLAMAGRIRYRKIGRDLHIEENDLEEFKKTMQGPGRPARSRDSAKAADA